MSNVFLFNLGQQGHPVPPLAVRRKTQRDLRGPQGERQGGDRLRISRAGADRSRVRHILRRRPPHPAHRDDVPQARKMFNGGCWRK